MDQENSINSSSVLNSEGNSTSEIQSSMNSGSSSITKPQAYPHSKLHHELSSVGSTPPQQTMSDNSSGIYQLYFIMNIFF